MNTNNSMKKATIYATIFFAVIFLIGMVFFKKDDNDIKENNSELNNQQLINDTNNKEITEEEKLKSFAENFTVTYHSYTWGNFSNIESQYYYMTDEMGEEEKDKVEKMKEEIRNQPQKYFTARAKLMDSDFISYEEAKAILEINLNVDNYAGAIVQRDTMVWVDEKGDYYEGNLSDLIINAVEKKIKIELVKISNEWKINEIEETGK